jgi:hypothetical protein
VRDALEIGEAAARGEDEDDLVVHHAFATASRLRS